MITLTAAAASPQTVGLALAIVASLAQLAEHAPRKRTVAGSIPAGGLLALLAARARVANLIIIAVTRPMDTQWAQTGESGHPICDAGFQSLTHDRREILTPSLPIWSQTRCRCAIQPFRLTLGWCLYRHPDTHAGSTITSNLGDASCHYNPL